MFQWNEVYMNSCTKQRITELRRDLHEQKRLVFSNRKDIGEKKARI